MRETDKVVLLIEKVARDVHTVIFLDDDCEPLDGDETQMFADFFRLELDWHNGNITYPEYEEMRNLMMN